MPYKAARRSRCSAAAVHHQDPVLDEAGGQVGHRRGAQAEFLAELDAGHRALPPQGLQDAPSGGLAGRQRNRRIGQGFFPIFFEARRNEGHFSAERGILQACAAAVPTIYFRS